MAKIACAHPGKMGDALYALPSVRALCARHGEKADFYTSNYCRPLTKLLEHQSCIERVIIPENYRVDNFGCGGQPWEIPIPSVYDAVYQLGFSSSPSQALPDHISISVGLSPGLPIKYDFEHIQTIMEPYIVIAPHNPTTYASMFQEIVKRCLIKVVEIGSKGEGTGLETSIDLTGHDMYDSLPWISRSVGFVGLMSSQLVLANGFPIIRIAPHDGISWDMNHVIHSSYNEYPILPSAEQILSMIESRTGIPMM